MRIVHCAFWLALLALSVVLGARPSRSAAACVGDCDAGGTVTVDELIIIVDIALGTAPLSSCVAGDTDGSGTITIDEIVVAVNTSLGACPLPTATPTPTAPRISPTPTLGPLGTRHFVLNPAHSTFTAVFSTSVSFPLGTFQGQKNGETGLPGYLDLQAGPPDNQGVALINIVDASDYLYVDATAQAQAVVCLKPIVPVANAGLVACKGGLDFSVALTQNHHLGQIGIDGFTADECASQSGSIEVAPHPGVCNGTFEVGQLGGNSGPGAVSISPVPQFGLHGLPVEISTELALPCGDEGPGAATPFAFTSASVRSTILNLNNLTGICGAGTVDSSCTINADCDTAAGAGDGVCGAIFQYDTHGENFSCTNWTASDAPGCLVFSAPQLDANPQTVGADLITTFTFCGR